MHLLVAMEKTKFDGDSVDSLDAAIAKQFASENVSTPQTDVKQHWVVLGIAI